MSYAYRISTMPVCTLHQYQTVSVCYDLTQLQCHKECQQSTILSARFFAPCPAPAPAFLLLTCNVVRTLHAYVSTRRSAAGALGVEAAESARYAVGVEVAAYASTSDSAASGGSCSEVPCQSHGDSGETFHISERMFPNFQCELKMFE